MLETKKSNNKPRKINTRAKKIVLYCFRRRFVIETNTSKFNVMVAVLFRCCYFCC